MPKSAIADVIATMPLFARLQEKQRRELAKYCFDVTLPEGFEIVRQGAIGVDCYFIVDGTAVVSRSGVELAHLGAGAIVGEVASVDFHPRSATVTATSSLRALQIGARDLQTAIDHIDGMAGILLAAMAHRVRDLDAQLSEHPEGK